MVEDGLFINPAEGYVYIQGEDLIRRLFTGKASYTLSEFSQIAYAIVTAHGHEFNITDPGEPEDWVLTTDATCIELLMSYLDHTTLDLLELSNRTVDDLAMGSSITIEPKVTVH